MDLLPVQRRHGHPRGVALVIMVERQAAEPGFNDNQVVFGCGLGQGGGPKVGVGLALLDLAQGRQCGSERQGAGPRPAVHSVPSFDGRERQKPNREGGR